MNEQQEQMTLLHWFEHWERTTPDSVYLTQPCPNGMVFDYSWREVGDQARRMAAYLQSLNLPSRSTIAILGKNSAHWIIADLAIWMSGHISVPLYSTASADTVAYVLKHAEVRLLFVGRLDGEEAAWKAASKGVPANMPVISLPLSPRSEGDQWLDIIAESAPLARLTLPEPADLATVIYTSGSTGHPKGVMHSFGTMCNVAQINATALYNSKGGPGPQERLLSYLPLAHGAERQGVESTSLRYGMHVFFNDCLQTFGADLRRAQPTVFFSVPRLWTKFYQGINAQIPTEEQEAAFADPVEAGRMKEKILGALGLTHVHTAFTGSAPLPVPIINWYRQLGLELLDGYGMSENFACSHFSRAGRVRVGYVGECLPGVECRIAEDGEILVKSPGQMLGYYKQPELTAECYLPDGFFKTGDRGELDEQGRLRITGRVKELFKTAKGKYVAPVPIEAKLGGHPRLSEVCVTGVGLPQPFALVTLSEETRLALACGVQRSDLAVELQELLDQVNAQLEDHEQLDCLVVVKDPWTIDGGLLTPTMKIRRTQIEERYVERAETWCGSRQKVIFE
jgi:long-chain acyl-CoA synthetase